MKDSADGTAEIWGADETERGMDAGDWRGSNDGLRRACVGSR